MISSGFETVIVEEEGPPLVSVEVQPMGSARVDRGASIDLGVTHIGVPTVGEDTGV